jgi:hypothetical protein
LTQIFGLFLIKKNFFIWSEASGIKNKAAIAENKKKTSNFKVMD